MVIESHESINSDTFFYQLFRFYCLNIAQRYIHRMIHFHKNSYSIFPFARHCYGCALEDEVSLGNIMCYSSLELHYTQSVMCIDVYPNPILKTTKQANILCSLYWYMIYGSIVSQHKSHIFFLFCFRSATIDIQVKLFSDLCKMSERSCYLIMLFVVLLKVFLVYYPCMFCFFYPKANMVYYSSVCASNLWIHVIAFASFCFDKYYNI